MKTFNIEVDHAHVWACDASLVGIVGHQNDTGDYSDLAAVFHIHGIDKFYTHYIDYSEDPNSRYQKFHAMIREATGFEAYEVNALQTFTFALIFNSVSISSDEDHIVAFVEDLVDIKLSPPDPRGALSADS